MRDLTVGHEGKLIFRFAVPMILGNVFQQFYNIVDSVIVGNILGKEALASVGASFPIIFALIALMIGIAVGGTVVISQYYGAKDFVSVKKAIDTLYIVLFGASVFVSIVGIVFSDAIFRLLQLPPELIPHATEYLNIYLGGIVVFFGFNGTSAILRGLGDSVTPLYFLITATLLNIGLDFLFILGFHWGIAGAAWATIVSQGLAFAGALFYLHRTNELLRFSLKLNFNWKIFIQSIKIGLPSGLQQTFVAMGMMALMGIVNTFGTNVIAAYTAAGRIDSFATMFAMSFSQALSTFTGQNIGASRFDRIKNGFRSTLLVSSLVCFLITLVIFIFRSQLMRIFTHDPEVIAIGAEYLMIVSAFYFLFSAMFVTNGVMRGAGATLIPMFITLFSLWIIRIPFAYFLSSKIGYSGIWWAIPIAWFLGAAGAILYYRSGKWKNKTVFGKKL